MYLQISGRILLMIIMTYCFGKGQFWPIMALIVIHMVALAIGSIVSRVCRIEQSCNIELVLYSCLFGLANIYCPNWISYQNKDEKKHGKHTYTILREVVIQIVLILENFAMLSTVIYCAVWKEDSSIYKQDVLMKLAIFATCVHLVGVGLRMIYYNKYHIWRSVLWRDFWTSLHTTKRKLHNICSSMWLLLPK